jgi:pimeloyl-ACP methyl ester carboxylesterase
MVAGASRGFQGQATAFEPVGNIFAPYYRQAATDILALPFDQQQAIVTGIPKTCIFAAFDYYINTLNQGRPFILAGHSQGSNILVYLLSEYMALHPDVYRRMIAAYVIGYSITPDYLARNPHLKFATGPDDTGVIVSYNTEAPVLLPPGDPVVLPGALVINPISWATDETLAPASRSAGSLTLNPDGTVALDTIPVMNYADAKIDKSRSALICSSVNQQSLIPVTEPASIGVYHSLDYALYYFNIRQNAQNRVNRYLGKDGDRLLR